MLIVTFIFVAFYCFMYLLEHIIDRLFLYVPERSHAAAYQLTFQHAPQRAKLFSISNQLLVFFAVYNPGAGSSFEI